jgi:septum site-determining protein MinD
MLQAMNTGHDGSMTTTHANSPREAIARLETLCLMAGMDLPVRSIREQIAGAVHLIIQISRLPDGSRKIMSITEVQGMQGDVVTLQEIFKFKETGFDRKTGKILGTFQVGGAVPKFIEVFERKGIKIPRSIFQATPTPETSAANTTSVPPKKVGG